MSEEKKDKKTKGENKAPVVKHVPKTEVNRARRIAQEAKRQAANKAKVEARLAGELPKQGLTRNQRREEFLKSYTGPEAGLAKAWQKYNADYHAAQAEAAEDEQFALKA